MSDFGDAVLGIGLPADVQRSLAEAARERAVDPARSMFLLMRAQSMAPDHPAVLIALYRHHFYGHQLAAARHIARHALVVGARALGLPLLWSDAPPLPLPGARSEARTRFFLFALKGYAYLSLRLGDANEARDALAKLRLLDPEDCVGGALLETVRLRALAPGASDDEDAGATEEAQGTAFGAAAWARASAYAASA